MNSERGRVPYGAPTNGLYTFRPYVYRGTGHDTLTADDTLTAGLRRGPRPGKRAPVPSPDGRCGECGYMLSGRNHKVVCG
jgi:hypothetical protein